MGWRWNDGWRTGCAYLFAAVVTIVSTRFEGGVACLWLAGAVLISALSLSPRRRWPSLFGWCGAASMVATVTVGVGAVAAVPLMAVNMLEAWIAATLLDRFGLRRDPMDTMGRLAALIVAVGVVAPLAAAPLGAGVVAFVTGTPFGSNLRLWLGGHALGNIAAVPVFTFIASGAVRRWLLRASREQMMEAGALLTLVLAVTAAVFTQNGRPLLFLPILPVILATFRIGRMGAAISVLVIATVGGWCTVRGLGPVGLVDGSSAARAQFFQFYLAATVLTALPVAVELRRRRHLFERLRDSEARFRLLAENSSDIVMSMRADGTVRYVSPAIVQLGGLTPETMLGRRAVEFVLPEHRDELIRAHLEALADPDRTIRIDYRAYTASGELRWFESNMRGVRDADGTVSGTVGVVRDVSHRKAIEGDLARAAATDPLTGLANRRAFDAALDRLLGGQQGGCVAVVDLDHFKQVNDRYGHEAGDRVLQAFAELARGALREGDLVARIGGEEFGLLLPGADAGRGEAVCERVRDLVAGVRLPIGGGTLRVTASVGLAVAARGLARADVMRQADEALYRAKTEGRNRLRLAA